MDRLEGQADSQPVVALGMQQAFALLPAASSKTVVAAKLVAADVVARYTVALLADPHTQAALLLLISLARPTLRRSRRRR